MNIVEFAIKFKDLASSELGKFGAQSRRTFAQAQQYTDQLTGHNRVLGKSYDEIQLKIKQVENTIRTSTIPSQIRAARRELELLQRQSNSHIGNISSGGKAGGGLMNAIGLGSMAKMAGPMAIGAGLLAAGSFMGDSFGKSLERQKIQTSFNVLAGGEQQGGELTKQLVSLQKDTILGPEVFKNAQTMMAFGESSKTVAKDLKMLGDISMGDKERLGSLTLAFSQSQATGRLMGQDLLQMVNAGFNPLQVMSEKTGKSMAVLKKEMESGNISFAMVKQAFVDATSEGGKFNNMLEKIGETPAGKMEQLKGSWQEFKVQAGTAFMPLISAALDLGTKLMPILTATLEPLTKGIKLSVDLIKQYKGIILIALGPITAYLLVVNSIAFATKIWTAAQWLLNVAMDANPVGLIILGVSALVALIVVVIKKYNQWGAAITLLMGPFGMLINVIMSLKRNWDSIVQAFKSEGIIGGIKRIGVVMIDALLYPIQKLLHYISKIPGMGNIAGNAENDIIALRNKLNLVTPQSKKVVSKDGTIVDATNTDLMSQIAKNTADNAASSKNAEKAVTGGGPKTINVTVGKFLDSINLHTANLKEGTADIEGIFLEMFARVVAQGAKAM